MTKLHAVTALYDIGRAERGDGRTIEQYLRWLNRTLRLPVPFTLYLDPAIDAARVAPKPGDNIVSLPWDQLATAKWLPQVEEICRDPSRFVKADDLTYRLPKYGLVNFAKFGLMARTAAGSPSASHVMWVDAGAARFTPFDFGRLRLRERLVDDLTEEAVLALGARRALRDYLHGKPVPQLTGLCAAPVQGATLLVRREGAKTLFDLVHRHVETQWLAHGLWDNEQTALTQIILARQIGTAIQSESGAWISLLGALFEPVETLPPGQRWFMRRDFWNAPLPYRLFHFRRLAARAAFRRWRYGGPENREIAALIRAEGP